MSRSAMQEDPIGAAKGASRVLRGGGWNYGPAACRAGRRFKYYPDARHDNIGFRVVVSVFSSRASSALDP